MRSGNTGPEVSQESFILIGSNLHQSQLYSRLIPSQNPEASFIVYNDDQLGITPSNPKLEKSMIIKAKNEGTQKLQHSFQKNDAAQSSFFIVSGELNEEESDNAIDDSFVEIAFDQSYLDIENLEGKVDSISPEADKIIEKIASYNAQLLEAGAKQQKLKERGVSLKEGQIESKEQALSALSIEIQENNNLTSKLRNHLNELTVELEEHYQKCAKLNKDCDFTFLIARIEKEKDAGLLGAIGRLKGEGLLGKIKFGAGGVAISGALFAAASFATVGAPLVGGGMGMVFGGYGVKKLDDAIKQRHSKIKFKLTEIERKINEQKLSLAKLKDKTDLMVEAYSALSSELNDRKINLERLKRQVQDVINDPNLLVSNKSLYEARIKECTEGLKENEELIREADKETTNGIKLAIEIQQHLEQANQKLENGKKDVKKLRDKINSGESLSCMIYLAIGAIVGVGCGYAKESYLVGGVGFIGAVLLSGLVYEGYKYIENMINNPVDFARNLP